MAPVHYYSGKRNQETKEGTKEQIKDKKEELKVWKRKGRNQSTKEGKDKETKTEKEERRKGRDQGRKKLNKNLF